MRKIILIPRKTNIKNFKIKETFIWQQSYKIMMIVIERRFSYLN